MKLITEEQRARLLANGKARDPQQWPVVKLFCPWGAATWLLSELNPDDPDIAFGLADLGMGEPELGYIYLPEIVSLRGPGGLCIERDLYFTPEKSLVAYADEAREKGYLST